MIKIIRFMNGEDIICNLANEIEGMLTVEYPLSIKIEQNPEIQKNIILLEKWISDSLCKEQIMNLNIGTIQCLIEPSEKFSEYYKETAEKLFLGREDSGNYDEIPQEELLDILLEAQQATLQ